MGTVDRGRCAHPGCEATHKLDRWNNVRAHYAGWYQQKDGRSWCPDHRPPWAPPAPGK